jgi:AraC-like DNA-binding protein
VDNLGKHLEKDKGQKDERNRCVLDILDRIGSLEGLRWDPSMEQVARQAHKIRGNFFDNTKQLEDCIPQVLLVRGDYLQEETAPRGLFAD